ncbi:MAG: HD domain-containing protein [Planctomycetota bacterium]|nr:HD domain-containing protein [Planctomycetota bacterium]MDA1211551.1 HD domain-containing protein [Planctomycetota bacterium]
MSFSELVERAMRVAARWHRDQTRKASDLPYLTHPASVMTLLVKVGIDDDEILAAALLHDVLEDTSCPIEVLATEFPPRVLDFVQQLTERKRDDEGAMRPWKIRKTESIEHLRSAPWEVRAISLADKLHNLGTMVFDIEAGEAIWKRFGASPDQILWYYEEIVREATQDDARLISLANQCRQLIQSLRDSITDAAGNATGLA